MQASAVLLFAFSLQVSAATYSQTVSFTGKDVPLKNVFASVKKQTGFGFFYENGEEATLKGAGNVTLDLKNVALDLFLQVVLRNQPLEYSVEGTTVFVKRKEVRSSVTVELSDSARIPEIRGRVTNDKGEPLVNANVVVKRTGRGTVTDANGGFRLQNVSPEDIITITFIGYKPQSIPLRDRTSLTLVMVATTNDLDKVVVQAYGTTSQRLATGNIGKITSEDIARQPIMNPLQAIQGQVAGVVVTQTNGFASSPIKIEIRGRSTINPNFPSDPLYIIDGVPLTVLEVGGNSNYNDGSQGFIQNGLNSPANGQSPFFSMNPSDIESIEILKDADATAIYGSRGANGVILITTKKGKAGKTHFDLNVYDGVSQVPRFYEMLNTKQYLEVRREAFVNDNQTPDNYSAPDIFLWDTTRYTNWQKYLWGGTGKTTDLQSSLSGGDQRTNFRIGAGYRRQTDILTKSGANERSSVSLNLTHRSINQRLTLSFSAAYSYAVSNMISVPNAATLPPNAPAVFDRQGHLNYKEWTAQDQLDFPFFSLLKPYTSKTNFLNTSFTLSYEILKGLSFKTTVGYNNAMLTQTSLNPISSQDPRFKPKGSAAFGTNNLHNLIVEPLLEYNTFLGKGKLNAFIGGSRQSNTTNGEYVSGTGYTNDALLKSINNAKEKSVFDNYGEYKYAAIFSRINYNLFDKYIINLNARRDGSSRFGPGRQFGNFGSIAAAWIFSEEALFKNKIHFISFGKLRASYGSTGNDQIGDYQFLSQWTSSGYFPYNGILSLVPTKHTDSLLHWEVNRKTELALDLNFLKDRITFEISWYRNRCNNQLVSFPTPNFSGFSSVTSNSPADVENTGWEYILNSKIIETSKFKWISKFNIGINKNKLLAYPNLQQSPYADYFIIGKSLNIKKLLHYTGVTPQTGLYAFSDKNKDGNITIDLTGKNPDDRYFYDLSPKYSGGWSNNFTFNNWELNLLFFFKKQLGVNALSAITPPGGLNNAPIEALHRWQKPGDISSVAKFTTSPYTDESYPNFQQFSDGTYTDASFIRLQNLSLSYRLSDSFTRRLKIQACKIYIEGQNLFIISNYKGIDPEVQQFGGMPLSRVITGGISLNL